MKTYELHGLRVRSDYALASPVETDLCDLEVRRGAPGAIADEPPDGEVLARLDLPSARWTLVRQAAGYLQRFPGMCDVAISEDRRSIVVHPAEGG